MPPKVVVHSNSFTLDPKYKLIWLKEMRYTLHLLISARPMLDDNERSSIWNAVHLEHIQEGPAPPGCGFPCDAPWRRCISQYRESTASGIPGTAKYRPIPQHWKDVLDPATTQEERDWRQSWEDYLDETIEGLTDHRGPF